MSDFEPINAENLLREHEVVEEIIWQLERLVEEGNLIDRGPGWNERLCNELSVFHDHLQRHFELEEENGYMLDVVALLPHASESVEELRQEHNLILDSISELIREGDSLASASDPALVTFRKRVGQLLSAIRRHEAEENALVHRIYSRPETAID